MPLTVMLFGAGIVLLIWGGDWFVDGAVDLARRFRWPEGLVGATVVSVGTTLPEVMVTLQAAVRGHGELGYGNAVGSILCNTALIAGLSATIRPGAAERESVRLPVVFFFLAAGVWCLSAYGFGGFGRGTGLCLLALFGGYLLATLRQLGERPGWAAGRGGNPLRELGRLILGAGTIALGAHLLVEHGTALARALGVPESVIGLTLVALGTSLPELATAITALRKGHGALSLGNILGANLMDLALAGGAAAAVAPFPLPEGRTLAGISGTLVLDLPLMVLSMALLTLPALRRGRTCRWQGIVLLALYAGFCWASWG